MADDGETATWAHHRMGRGEVLAAHAVCRDRLEWPGKAEGEGIMEVALCKGESMLVEGHHRQPRRRTFLSLGWTKGRGELVRAAPTGVPLSFL